MFSFFPKNTFKKISRKTGLNQSTGTEGSSAHEKNQTQQRSRYGIARTAKVVCYNWQDYSNGWTPDLRIINGWL
ncbi:hypothetical protein WH43_02815 [Rheinheimera sp. KL1]|nr:hypothetical protein WH43_02815 [Rheinheimera sp. KL1]